VIHAFNTQGFAAQDPKWSGGRPPKFGPVVRELICRVAKTPPNRLGRPFTTWSLSKLAEYLTAHHRVVIGAESVRQILRRAGISWQATKTWKASGESGHPGWPDSWPQRALMMTPTLNYKELVNDAQSPCLLRSTPIKVFEVMDELLKPQ
jgi:transposase